MATPSKTEQIEALIHHKTYELVMKFSTPKQSDAEAYKEVFTVKRQEIIDYLQRHYSLKDLVFLAPETRDGFYAILEENKYKIYEQERCIKFTESYASNEREVWSSFADYLINTSGTALKFSD